jgi:glycosyltransferase involved in cell wall biosynthesis
VRALDFVYPGDLATLTGGYRFDRRIIEGLRGRGWRVTCHALDPGFPAPSDDAMRDADAKLRAIPDGRLTVIDGLAYGAMPEVAAAHAERIRLIALVHHPLADETGLAPGAAERLWQSERHALAVARRVIVTSRATARALVRFDVPAARIDVVEPGTDPASLARGSEASGLALLCVGAITPRKGHAVLIDALARVADRPWHLVCVGNLDRSPATAADLRHRIDALGLSTRVTLTGEKAEDAIGPYYDRADVFVLPSFHEGYGMVLAEALARGLPIVSTRAGAIPDTVPQDAGLLVPPGDAAALAGALAALLDDRALRARLAAGARAARDRLPSWDAACSRFADALECVAAA